jgi:chemosensory pili system protein ChpA (sensor histidine kinase/response regulator)
VKVLVIDDDAVVGEMYRLALTRAGHDVTVARDGPAGLQIAGSAQPGMIFLDIRMPRMDGIEVLRNLAADTVTRDIPVVMLSNYDDATYVRQCMGLGAKEYIVKAAIRPGELDAVVTRWARPAA